jgi:hypothetical protein
MVRVDQGDRMGGKRRPPDASDELRADLQERIHWEDTAQVQMWSRRLGITPEALIGALKAVGPSIAAVKRLLKLD